MTTLEPVRMAKEVGEEYSSSLADLTMNSKPLINMLTILAEESIEHAAVIVQSVEKHLDKVRPDIKLPVLYLVDSIIKNVGGAYTQLFAQIIVNMFCKVFKQVDEKTRSQMFKLRETWHDVFPTVKLYQLDVKVNLIDPAWPIQARPTQSNIHVNPNFLNRAVPTTNAPATVTAVSAPGLTPEEIKMREAVARKQHELKMIEMELQRKEKELMEQKRALEKKAASQQQIMAAVLSNEPPLATHTKQKNFTPSATPAVIHPVAPRIAPVNPALLSTARRKDPRLAHLQTNSSQPQIPITQEPSQQSTVKLADPRIFRKPESAPSVSSPSKQEKSPTKHSHRHSDKKKNTTREHLEKSRDPSDVVKTIRIDKLPPIPKIRSSEKHSDKQMEQVSSSSPTKRKKEIDSPKSNRKHKKSKDSSPKDLPETKVHKKSSEEEGRKQKIKKLETEVVVEKPATETFKEIKRRSKERNYIRRNREKSESPEDVDLRLAPKTTTTTVPESNGATSGDVDLRTLPPVTPVVPQRKRSPQEPVQHEPNKKSKSGKLDELFGHEDVDLRTLPVVDEPVRPIIDSPKSPSPDTKSSAPIAVKKRSTHKKDDKESEEDEGEGAEDESSLGDIKNVEGGWAKVKEIQSPQVLQKQPSLSNLDTIRAKLANATKKDGLGRLKMFSPDENCEKKKINSKDTDMRLKNKLNLEGNSIKIIMTQAEEELQSGNLNKDQYNVLLMQVLQLNERQKLKEAKQKESLEASKRRLQWLQQKKGNEKSDDIARERSSSPESVRSADSPVGPILDSAFGDIDERVPPSIPISNSPAISVSETNHVNQKDCDMRMVNQIPEKIPDSHPGGGSLNHKDVSIDNAMIHENTMVHENAMIHDNNVPLVRPEINRVMPPRPENMHPAGMWAPRGFPPRGFRGPRPRNEEWGGPRGFRSRGPMGGNWRMPMGNRVIPDVPERMPLPPPSFFPVEPRKGSFLGPNPLPAYVKDENSTPPPIGLFPTKEFTRVNPEVLEYMQKDTMKSISIDGVTRDIRFYDKTAIVLLDWDDPREIFFQPGQRRLSIDDQTISLHFNQDYSTFSLDGTIHKIKFGSPTRELFIDDMWFECFFGGPPIPILLDGKVRLLGVDGPPPQVTIGDKKRSDLCAGKINIVIDAINTAPIFLDAKPQLVEIGGVPHSLRFVDALETVLINEKPYRVEFGGLPKPFTVNKKKHYIRFTVLPRTIKAGAVIIANMEGKKPDPMVVQPVISTFQSTGIKADTEASNSLGGLDMLASILPSSIAPSPQAGSYSAHSLQTAGPNQTDEPLKNIDIGSLFAKLVDSGILQNPVVSKAPKKTPATRNEVDVKKVETRSPVEIPSSIKCNTSVVPVNLNKSETLKIKQPGLVNLLHSGMQCGSCGARFPPEHTTRYSQHLDWHFRQNRAEKDSQRRPHSRRWYYDISDWVQFEEIEDLEEREKSWFEKQQEEGAAVETSESGPSLQEEVTILAPPPSAPPNQFKCSHCGDPFHQFYNQELEEWQLRRAVTFENNNYHPDCLEEYKEGLVDKIDETIKSTKDEDRLKEENEWEDEDQEQMDSSSDIKLVSEEQEGVSEDKENQIDEDEAEDESIVEVLSEKSQEEVEEVDLIDDDDVVIKTEPVVEITVDDQDTDEETEKERAARDEQYQIDFSKIKIKQEPVDPDDEPVITSEEIITTHADTTHAAVISSIDGNVQLQPAAVQNTTVPATIRINITNPLVAAGSPTQKANDHVEPQETPHEDSSTTEEEPEYTVKSSLEGVIFTKYPPVTRGNELSGLCSLM